MTTGAAAEWRANWGVVLAAAVATTMPLTYLYSTGVLIPSIEKEFGWSRAEISSGSMIVSVVAVLFSPLVGMAIDRYGARRIGLIGATAFFIAFAALSTATASIWSWWALWLGVAITATLITPSTWTAAVSSLFDRSRGLALAIGLTGSGLGTMLVPLVASNLLHLGWRSVYIGMAGLWAVVTLPILFLFFFSAKDKLRTGRMAASGLVKDGMRGMTMREAMRSGRFIRLAIGACAIMFVASGMVANMVPILASSGMDVAKAAKVAALVGIGSIVGRFVGGMLLDRINGNIVAGTFVAVPIGSILLLILFPGSAGMAMIAALTIGLAVGVEYDAVAYLTARHFGIATFGSLFGTVTGTLVLMGGIAPLATNRVYDVMHSYTPALWAFIPICALSSLMFWSLGAYPARNPQSGDEALEEVGAALP